ncbi:MAG: 23S rRNA (guanosine(2251)-2'-O)-methyltransferase RlmB [Acholeplasmataceae bacterium]|jgi:predicted rRNA methylase|nr:23S rRNA (guanosine(2251)-2'-O)-methyltransferase RlmB [Acholeplasmataceae bacterium]
MIIFGKNVVKEAIFAKREIYHLYIDDQMNDHRFLDFLKDKGVSYQQKSKHDLNVMTSNQLHQGVVADVKDYETYQLEDVINENEIQHFLILDGIEDPHNLGAIMRTAEAIQLQGIIMSKKNAVPLNATVAKVSSGAIEHVKIILVSNVNQAILQLKKHHVWVVGTDGHTDKTYDDLPKNVSLAIVMGNEGEGIRPLVKQNCDLLVKIPMFGKINSLNVSVAAALMMYKMKEHL